MKLRVCLCLLGALAVASCSDRRDILTENSDSPDLASATNTTRLNVLLRAPATAANRTELSKHGVIYDEIVQINVVLMKTKADQIAAIRALPFVAQATEDGVRDIGPIDLIPGGTTDFAGSNNVWNLDAVNVTDKLSAGRKVAQDGSNVYIAVLDTGLLPSWRAYFPEARIATQYAKSFGGGGGPNGDNTSEQPHKWEQDVNAHGTHVTSIVLGYQYTAASTGGFFQVDGVAPKATVIPVKVLNQNGSGQTSMVAQGVVYIADLVGTDGLLDGRRVVINMSLGGGVLDAIEKAALDYAIARNIVIVATAGNNGPAGQMGFPGAYAPVISVAAAGWTGEWDDPAPNCTALTNGADALQANRFWRQCDVAESYSQSDFYVAGFSALRTGTQDLDVAAPGSWVLGPYQTSQGKISYFFVGGTSQAAPHVTGIVALMLQKNPSLAATAVEGLLVGAAHPLNDVNQTVRPGPGLAPAGLPDWTADRSGAGLITADAALASVP